MRRFIAATILLAVPVSMHAQQRLQVPSDWRVDPKVALDIPSEAPNKQVVFARVSGATRLANGTIVISDADDNSLHFFDATGKAIRSVGRAGSGPGEFRNVSWLGRCSGDSLHVWDMLQHRMSVFAPSGAFARQYQVPADTARAATPLLTLACSSRGTLVYQGSPARSKTMRAPKDPAHPTREERAFLTTAPVSIGDVTGKVSRTIPDRPGGALYMVGNGGFPLPLAARTLVAVAGDRVFVGIPDSTATIMAYQRSRPDAPPTVIHLTVPARPVTEAQREFAASTMASLAPPSLRKLAEDSLRVAPMPSTLPPYSVLLGDPEGVLWVEITVPGDPATRLRAIGPTNAVLADITLPPNVLLHEIGRDYILASYAAPDGAPHLVMFTLHRGK